MLSLLNNQILSLEAKLKLYEKELADLRNQIKEYQTSVLIKFEKGTYFKFELDRISFALANYSYKNFLKTDEYVFKTISHEVKKLDKLSYVHDSKTNTFLMIDEDGNGISDVNNTVINTALDLIRHKVSQHTSTFYKTAEDDPTFFKKHRTDIDIWKNGVYEVKGNSRDALINKIFDQLKEICVIKTNSMRPSLRDDDDVWGVEMVSDE